MSKASVVIDGVTYVREFDAGPAPEFRIVVIEGRWNVIGRVRVEDNGDLTITQALVIRVWGTTKGLGQLAIEGPTSKTILDPVGTLRVPAHAVLLTIDVTSDWSA